MQKEWGMAIRQSAERMAQSVKEQYAMRYALCATVNGRRFLPAVEMTEKACRGGLYAHPGGDKPRPYDIALQG